MLFRSQMMPTPWEETKINIRSRPEKDYEVVGTVSTGDRVAIFDIIYDKRGNIWYKIYHPKSGKTGWIEAQFINLYPTGKNKN